MKRYPVVNLQLKKLHWKRLKFLHWSPLKVVKYPTKEMKDGVKTSTVSMQLTLLGGALSIL